MTPFTATLKVRFAEIDRAGIVYYPRYFHYLHVAFEEFFEKRVGVPYPVLLDARRVGFPTVHAACDYHAPVEFGDVLGVEVGVARIGRTSVDFRYRVRNRTRRRGVAEALVTVVCVDMDSFRPRAIPPYCLRAFRRNRVAAKGR